MTKKFSGNQIRQTFIDFFVAHGHTFVPSMSLVPGGDAPCSSPTRAWCSSRMSSSAPTSAITPASPTRKNVCAWLASTTTSTTLGRDDTHHTFFEMLGNWSFGDYYKEEAIAWSWQLLTEVWGLPKDKLYATCFKDDKGNVPTDEEAADIWKKQPGFDPSHVLYFGRKENFWQMAEVGPCGPCSEIHIDLGEEHDNLRGHAAPVRRQWRLHPLPRTVEQRLYPVQPVRRWPLSSRCPPSTWIRAWALSALWRFCRASTRTTRRTCFSGAMDVLAN
jgi:alanyl-tRNA synthetase